MDDEKLYRTDYDEYNASVFTFKPQVYEEITSFGMPVQVMFWHPWSQEYRAGIGYKEVVIDAESGVTYTITNIAQMAPDNRNPIEFLGDWVDFSEKISR
jgi:hypothetical protein